MINFRYYKPKLLVLVVWILWMIVTFIINYISESFIVLSIAPIGAIMTLLVLYDKYLWNKKYLCLLNVVPDLSGTYEGFVDFEYEGILGKKSCKATIVQTCSYIKIKCNFSKDDEKDTSSESLVASIETDHLDEQKLYFYYQNEGSCMNGATLSQHAGMNVLNISRESDGYQLSGHYFTNRDPQQTKGRMKLIQQLKFEEENGY